MLDYEVISPIGYLPPIKFYQKVRCDFQGQQGHVPAHGLNKCSRNHKNGKSIYERCTFALCAL